MIETEDVQNSLSRMREGVYLNTHAPSISLKKQYHKALGILTDARHEFDILNDMKEIHKRLPK